MKKFNTQGIRNIAKSWHNHPEIDSVKVNEDNNYDKPLNEVPEKIQRRENKSYLSSSYNCRS